VSSSSESDSEIEVQKKSKSKTAQHIESPEDDPDVSMADADASSPQSTEPETSTKDIKPKPQRDAEDFSAIYLRKITAELADDLDKVREANDFTIRSVPMLVHALRQGVSCFSAEERARVVGAANQ
jgi:hypothetical protein